MRKFYFLLTTCICLWSISYSQAKFKSLPSTRTIANIHIDGKIDEAAWKEATPATDFVEWRPNFGRIEEAKTRTEVWILYDNTAIYVAGFCHESRDSLSKELIGRDEIGINDYVGIMFDTYNDKINAVGFYVTPLGEQFDAKYSATITEDESWNAVWDSEAQVREDGWTFEMKIPYSALRFVSKENQNWGLQITRRRQKSGRQYMWNPIDPTVNGLVNQEGQWTGIEKIKPPIRLSFSPYFSTYLNHYPYHTDGVKDWTSSVNGGMDVKYGISDAFTLDMTLIPDFGQVQSDNKVLNLSPFEVRYNENRSFFTEGTELFNKGGYFYSRRVGGTPLHYGDIYGQLGQNEEVIKNPVESKLINATKVSGRTKGGLGIGFFNGITKTMYATVEDSVTHIKRKVETGPLSNYNIIVFDQTLKNNSSISFLNASVIRSGRDYDANLSSALFNFNNKKNTYRFNGKFSISQLSGPDNHSTGYGHTLSFGKTGGNWTFSLFQDLMNDRFNYNDIGIQFTNNYIDHNLTNSYRWLKPGKWYNNIQLSNNIYYSRLLAPVPGQKINSNFQGLSTGTSFNVELKNLWHASMFVGYVFKGNDFYEPRNTGYSFHTPRRLQFNPAIESDETKKYAFEFNYFVGLRSLFNSPNNSIYFAHRFRFNDKFSLTHELNWNPTKNDAGFYDNYYQQDVNGNYILDANGNPILQDILFSRRNLRTVENIVSFKWSFNKRSGVTVRVRHYWSKVDIKQLYDLQTNGDLLPTTHTQVVIQQQNFNILNVDAVYTWEFAPGSFINIVWKDEGSSADEAIRYSYLKNLNNTFSVPQNNNLSFKIIYYLDYLKFKRKR